MFLPRDYVTGFLSVNHWGLADTIGKTENNHQLPKSGDAIPSKSSRIMGLPDM